MLVNSVSAAKVSALPFKGQGSKKADKCTCPECKSSEPMVKVPVKTLVALLAATVGMSSCGKDEGFIPEPEIPPVVEPADTTNISSPVQKKMAEMFNVLGVWPVTRSYSSVKGDVVNVSYRDEANKSDVTYALNEEKSSDDVQVFDKKVISDTEDTDDFRLFVTKTPKGLAVNTKLVLGETEIDRDNKEYEISGNRVVESKVNKDGSKTTSAMYSKGETPQSIKVVKGTQTSEYSNVYVEKK